MASTFQEISLYLEAADIWPDFQLRLATIISGELNASLPAPYYAQLEMWLEGEDGRHYFVEIREVAGRGLVTVIEIVGPANPANKGAEPGREGYEMRRQEILKSDVNLIEVDLPRMGQFQGDQTLPCIPVPLRADETDIRLDLQVMVNRAYDSGPYRRINS